MPQLSVLHVEDNPDDVELVERLLSGGTGTPFELVHADSLGKARAMLRARTFDVVLLDLSLPDSEGGETVSTCLEAAADAVIVVMTGWELGTLGAQLMRAGAQGYVSKNRLTRHDLECVILDAVERHSTLRELREENAQLRRVVDELAQGLTEPLAHLGQLLRRVERSDSDLGALVTEAERLSKRLQDAASALREPRTSTPEAG